MAFSTEQKYYHNAALRFEKPVTAAIRIALWEILDA